MGADVRIDHSTAGGAVLYREAAARDKEAAEILAYCILGHHAGLPDRLNPTELCLDRRIERFVDGLDPAWRDAVSGDLTGIAGELLAHVSRETCGFDLSVAARMVFSCLVEADYRDTGAFYARLENRVVDRSWPALAEHLPDMIGAFDRDMAARPREGDLNALRGDILAHVRAGAALGPGLFTLTVPTGGGKTLASLGFALDYAARHPRSFDLTLVEAGMTSVTAPSRLNIVSRFNQTTTTATAARIQVSQGWASGQNGLMSCQ